MSAGRIETSVEGAIGWIVFAVLVVVGSSNAVNITDGVDGLAAGSSTFCFAVLSIMGYWIFRHYAIYHVLPASAIDLALVSVALAGACIGFLWWNAAPAKIIMGDTGSLSIGAGLAAICLLAGSTLFAWSLYALAFGAPHLVGLITPIGGLLMMAGWGILAAAAMFGRPAEA